MKCSIIDRSSICFNHLATPLQYTVDQSLYATLIQVGPRPSAKCAGIPPKRYRPSPSCWLSAWCYPRGSRWVAVGGSCRPFHKLNAIFLQVDWPPDDMLTRCWSRAAIGDEFVFMDDNARPHRARVADQFLEENGIEALEYGMACKIRLQLHRESLG